MDSDLDDLQARRRRPCSDGTVEIEDAPVAGTFDRILRVVPADNTAKVRTDGVVAEQLTVFFDNEGWTSGQASHAACTLGESVRRDWVAVGVLEVLRSQLIRAQRRQIGEHRSEKSTQRSDSCDRQQ